MPLSCVEYFVVEILILDLMRKKRRNWAMATSNPEMDPTVRGIADRILAAYYGSWPEGTIPPKRPSRTKAIIRGLASCHELIARACGENPESVCCYHKEDILPREKSGEYMKLDFVLSTSYPGRANYGDSAIPWGENRRHGLLLAAHSEWNSGGLELDDFYALTDVTSPFKVMVYSW